MYGAHSQQPFGSPAGDSDVLAARLGSSGLDCSFQTMAQRGILFRTAELYLVIGIPEESEQMT